MNPIYLFTSFSGRINRAKWWIGMIVLWVIAIGSSFLLNPGLLAAMTNPEQYANDPEALTELGRPTLAMIIAGVVLTILMLAVIIKRLHDRNWPSWVGLLVSVLYLGATVASYFMLYTAESMVTAQSSILPLSAVQFAVFLFLLIDNGMLKGTVGPNQYGADPLAHKHTDVA